MKYRKRPIILEAIQLTEETFQNCVYWAAESIANMSESACWIDLHTLEGTMRAMKYDYVIKGIKGEFYPCKPNIFDELYEAAE